MAWLLSALPCATRHGHSVNIREMYASLRGEMGKFYISFSTIWINIADNRHYPHSLLNVASLHEIKWCLSQKSLFSPFFTD